MSAGVVASFLPLAAGVSAGVAALGLFAQAVTSTASRWWAGRHGDRHGHAGLLVPGLLIAAAGMAVLIWVAAPVALITGMCLFGIGFGISQNATFALMIDRAPVSGYGTASALWNLAYDAGYGTGPIVFGVFVAYTGYPAAFALTGLLMLAALVPAVRDRRLAGHPPAVARSRIVPPPSAHPSREVWCRDPEGSPQERAARTGGGRPADRCARRLRAGASGRCRSADSGAAQPRSSAARWAAPIASRCSRPR